MLMPVRHTWVNLFLIGRENKIMRPPREWEGRGVVHYWFGRVCAAEQGMDFSVFFEQEVFTL